LKKGFGLQLKFPTPTPDAGVNVDFWLDNIAFTGANSGPPDGGTGVADGSGPGPMDAAMESHESGAADVSGP
jgi:hypothetical protein